MNQTKLRGDADIPAMNSQSKLSVMADCVSDGCPFIALIHYPED
jgi:hypothetical protein